MQLRAEGGGVEWNGGGSGKKVVVCGQPRCGGRREGKLGQCSALPFLTLAHHCNVPARSEPVTDVVRGRFLSSSTSVTIVHVGPRSVHFNKRNNVSSRV